MTDETERQDERVSVVAFRASADIRTAIERAAAREGLSVADVARRAVIENLGLRRDVAAA